MPFTPLHYPYAWLLSRLDRRLPLPALIVGSVIPDIECPILIVFFSGVLPDHFILHSLLGSLTIGLFLTVVITRYLYPPLVSMLFRVDKRKLESVCKVTPFMVLAGAIGILSHLIVDWPMHPYNQLLWPLVKASQLVGPLVLFFATGSNIRTGFLMANITTSLISLALWVMIVFRCRRNLWENMFLGEINYDQDASSVSEPVEPPT